MLSDDYSTGGNGGRSSDGGDSGIQLVAVVYIYLCSSYNWF